MSCAPADSPSTLPVGLRILDDLTKFDDLLGERFELPSLGWAPDWLAAAPRVGDAIGDRDT